MVFDPHCFASWQTWQKKLACLVGKKYPVSSHTGNGPLDFKIDAVGSAAVYLVPILSLSNI